MSLKMEKREFPSNDENKQRFINLLSDSPEAAGCEVHHAKIGADLLIVQTAIMVASQRNVILIGDDTDHLVPLCYHSKNVKYDLLWRPEPKKAGVGKLSYIGCARQILGEDLYNIILFVRAFLGCDKTSRVSGHGYPVALELAQGSEYFRDLAEVFGKCDSIKDEIIQAGEKDMLCMYKTKPDDHMDSLRHHRFQESIATSNKVIHPKSLPPTSGAVKHYSFRVFHQVQAWKDNSLNAEKWEWKLIEGNMTDLDAAPNLLLEVVRCKCKTGCGKHCARRRLGLDCTPACSECRGICENMNIENNDETSDDDRVTLGM